MRVLAIDHGTKRIGIAISDPLGVIAQPLETIPADPWDRFIARLLTILKEKQVELLLVGMPRNMDGSRGPAAKAVEEFVASLKAIVTLPIETLDERLTSKQAERILIEGAVRRSDRKGKVDKTAAAILLQSYLDRETGPF